MRNACTSVDFNGGLPLLIRLLEYRTERERERERFCGIAAWLLFGGGSNLMRTSFRAGHFDTTQLTQATQSNGERTRAVVPAGLVFVAIVLPQSNTTRDARVSRSVAYRVYQSLCARLVYELMN